MKSIKSIGLLIVLLISFTAPGYAAPYAAPKTATEGKPAQTEAETAQTEVETAQQETLLEAAKLDPYTVNPGDVLSISVWKEADLQREVLVRPDGHFSFPLAGDVEAAGKTIDEIRMDISEKLQRYITDTVVTISTLQINGNKVYVIGQVNKPGEFVVNPRVDVMQALAMAGGMTPFADRNDINILRRKGHVRMAIPFRYSDLERGKRLEQNIILQPGDVVVVP